MTRRVLPLTGVGLLALAVAALTGCAAPTTSTTTAPGACPSVIAWQDQTLPAADSDETQALLGTDLPPGGCAYETADVVGPGLGVDGDGNGAGLDGLVVNYPAGSGDSQAAWAAWAQRLGLSGAVNDWIGTLPNGRTATVALDGTPDPSTGLIDLSTGAVQAVIGVH